MNNTFIPLEGDAPADFGIWLRHSIEFEGTEQAAIEVVADPLTWHPKLENLQKKYSAVVYAAGEEFAHKVLGAVSHRRLALMNTLILAAEARGCNIDFDERTRVLTLSRWGAHAKIVIKKQAHPDNPEIAESLEVLVKVEFQHRCCIRDSRSGSVEERLSHVFLCFYESVVEQCTKTYEQRRQAWQESQDRWRAAIELGNRERAESAERRRARKRARDMEKGVLPEAKQVIPPPDDGTSQPQIAAAASAQLPGGGDPIENAAVVASPDQSDALRELIAEAGAYHLPYQIRAYVHFLMPAIPIDHEWVRWALSQADALCPVAARIAKLNNGGGDAAPSL